jgi:hypothetical protein
MAPARAHAGRGGPAGPVAVDVRFELGGIFKTSFFVYKRSCHFVLKGWIYFQVNKN